MTGGHQPCLNWLRDDLWDADGAMKRSSELTPLKVNRYYGPRVRGKVIPHDFWELGAVKAGEGRLCMDNGNVLPLRAGIVFLVPPRLGHIEESVGNIDIVFVGLQGAMLATHGNKRLTWVDSKSLVDEVETLWLRAVGKIGKIGPMLDGLARAIAADFMRQLSAPESDSEVRRIDELARIMRMRLSTKVRVPALARRMHCSPDYLRRLFKAHMGVSPTEYLVGLRMQQAMQLLEHSELPVAEIARQTGYQDPLYFSRIFKRKSGRTPLEYRRRIRP